jgi:N-acetylmuramoyl-L-alanine amidase
VFFGGLVCRAAVAALIGVTVAAGAASAATVYEVRPGDSLTAIARTHGTSVRTLARLNGLSPDGVLLAGSTLRLPETFSRYRVRPGDSLTSVAARVGISVVALARLNQMSSTQMLLLGTVLRVPVGTASARPSLPVHGETYTVQPGDSLSSIANERGVSLGALADLNRLSLGDVLPVGKRLVLPAGVIPSTLATYPRSTVRGSIVFWAGHYGVDPHLAAALAWMESGFNNELVSPAGAVGVMQVTPATWDYVEQVLLLGRRVPHDADGNVRVGVAYLHHLLRVFGGDERQALAAYYQGARAVQEAGFLPGTKQYVDDILALKARF